MNKKLYILKCSDCYQTFRTDDPDAKVCPSCMKYRQPHRRGRKKKRKKKILTFAEISHLTNVYYKIHHKYLNYGEMVNLTDSNVGRCICCGETAIEDKNLCAKCEKAGEQ